MLTPNATLTFPHTSNAISTTRFSWQIGEILNAIVQTSSDDGNVDLKIGSRNITARTLQTYQVGQLLRLEVLDNQQGLVLKKLDVGKVTDNKFQLESFLRTNLPKQANLQSLINRLNTSSPTLEKTGIKLPVLAKSIIGQLGQAKIILANLANLFESKSLKQAVMNSGVFLEAKIAASLSTSNTSSVKHAMRDLNTDLKANLLQLSDSLEQSLKAGNGVKIYEPGTATVKEPSAVEKTPKQLRLNSQLEKISSELLELKNSIDAALARIQVNQSRMVIANEQLTPLWVIDLPVAGKKYEGEVNIKIQYEEPEDTEAYIQRKWKLNLSIDIEPLGKIYACLTIMGKELSSSIWAEQESTNKLITKNLSTLETKLLQAGLNVIELNQHPQACEKSTGTFEDLPLVRAKV